MKKALQVKQLKGFFHSILSFYVSLLLPAMLRSDSPHFLFFHCESVIQADHGLSIL